MGADIGLEVGEIVPLNLQLGDGATSKFPQAEVRDQDDVLITIVSLEHKSKGLYAPATLSDITMPNKTSITATYIVYDDAPHTIVSAAYDRDLDTFIRINVDNYKANVSALALEANVETHAGNALTTYAAAKTSDLTAIDTKIDIIKGLSQENYRIFNPVYSGANLTSATIKIYSSAADCNADVGAIASYSIVATYDASNNMQTYKVTKV